MKKLGKFKSRAIITGAVVVIIAAFLVILALLNHFGNAPTTVSPAAKTVNNTSSAVKPQSKKKIQGNTQKNASSKPTQTVKKKKYPANAKVAYLTFDDGPSNLTPGLLKILKDNNVNATFFVVVEDNDQKEETAILKQEVQDGNVVGIHSWTHKYSYIYANEQNFLDDFSRMKNFIKTATGIDPDIMRFPGGVGNQVSISHSGGKIIMPKLVSDVEKKGVTPFDWTAGGEDAVSKVPPKDAIVRDVMEDAGNQKNLVILLHDSSTHASSIAAVPEIIKNLKARGYVFDTLSPDCTQVMQTPAKWSKYYKHPTVLQ